MEPLHKLRFTLVILACVLIAGTVGYWSFYPISPVDALYMTVITISTVGFREVVELDTKGKILTIFLILCGIGSITISASYLFQFMIDGHLRGLVNRRKMDKSLARLNDHYVVCGFGRVGQQVARDFSEAGKDFVVIDDNPVAVARLEERGYLYVAGDAKNDDILIQTGVERAKGIVAASDSDPDNVLICLSARILNPAIFIVARGSTDQVFDKLYKAGANRVVSPYLSSGQKMAAMMVKPLVHDYLETMVYGAGLEIRLEERELPDNSDFIGRSIADSAIRKRTGATIFAVKKHDGKIMANPPVTTVLEKGDHLILVGTADQMEQMGKSLQEEAGQT